MSTRDFDEKSITEAVIERFAETPDPRLKTVLNSLVRHLHDFARDIELSETEWLEAIKFLTRTGHICDDSRQEFILLSDVLGLSMLVDAINHRMPEGTTETTVLGPFYTQNPPVLENGTSIFHGQVGTPIHVTAHVSAPDGKPLADTIVDVWQADDDGFYDVQKPGDDPDLRARFTTDAKGTVSFWSIVPKSYPIPDDGPVGDLLKATKRHPYRPAHLHFMIAREGFETLVTHLFIDGDPYLDSDAVFGVKQSLIVSPLHHAPGTSAAGRTMSEKWQSLEHHFGLKPARKP